MWKLFSDFAFHIKLSVVTNQDFEMIIFKILFLFQIFLISSSIGEKKAKTFFDLSAKDIEGNEVQFDSFRGKVVMVIFHNLYSDQQGWGGFNLEYGDLENGNL